MRRQTNLRVLVYFLRCRCESVQACVHGLLTWVRSCHFVVMSYNPETSGVQPCGGDGNGLDRSYDVEHQGEVRVNKYHL